MDYYQRKRTGIVLRPARQGTADGLSPQEGENQGKSIPIVGNPPGNPENRGDPAARKPAPERDAPPTAEDPLPRESAPLGERLSGNDPGQQPADPGESAPEKGDPSENKAGFQRDPAVSGESGPNGADPSGNGDGFGQDPAIFGETGRNGGNASGSGDDPERKTAVSREEAPRAAAFPAGGQWAEGFRSAAACREALLAELQAGKEELRELAQRQRIAQEAHAARRKQLLDALYGEPLCRLADLEQQMTGSGSAEIQAYGREVQSILLLLGAEPFAPAEGEPFDGQFCEKMNAQAPGLTVARCLQPGWRAEDHPLCRAVVDVKE